MSINRTGGPALRPLYLIAVANQGDGCQRRKGEGSLLFAGVPGEESLHRAFVATDGAFGTIAGLQRIEPEREDLLRRRMGECSDHCHLS
jgi:hypothetical protein